MTFFLSWAVYPVLVIALTLGAGLGLQRLAGRRALPGVLLLPAGMAAIVTVSALTTQFDATAELTGPAILTIAVAGFAATRSLMSRLRPSTSWIWPGLAGFLPTATIAAPVVLTAEPGATGYTRIIDLTHQLDFTAWITSAGRRVPSATELDSSFLETIFQMTSVGYPGGSQAALGGTSALIGVDPIWSYQAFLALVAGGLGLTLYALLSHAIASRPWRALAAGVAAQPTILYSYALAAGIKELAAIAALALVAALLFARRPADGALRELIPVAVASASAFAVFSLGIVPWIGVLLLVALVADLLTRGRRVRTVLRWSALGVAVAILSVPTIIVGFRLAPVVAGGGPPDLGNLAAAVPGWSALGPWLTPDHRFPLELAERATLTYVLIAIVLAFVVLGLLWSLRRRDLCLLALVASGGVGLLFVASRTGPWVDLKAYTLTAPISLALAFAGAAALAHLPGRARRLAPVAIVAIAGSVLVGNALVYRDTTITPYERFSELEQIGKRYAGQGPALHPTLDDYPEYLLRDLDAKALLNNPPRPGQGLREGAREGDVFTRDLDEFTPAYVQDFPLLVLRRNPLTSRPPANYRRVWQRDYYEVWKRDSAPRTVRSHVPQTGARDERTARTCRDFARGLRAAGPGARVAYVRAPAAVQSGPVDPSSLPSQWLTNKRDHYANGPGRLRLPVTLPRSGRHRVWLRASVGREVRVLVDGAPLAKLRWDQSFPFQYVPLASAEFGAGEHVVEIVRGGGSLLPSTGNDTGPDGATTRLGPLAFVPEDRPSRVRTVSAEAGMKVCGSDIRLDWLEIVRREPRAARGASTASTRQARGSDSP
ncbi:MAG: hypothetical protein M3376_12060 [Actinomycetota bacterium]|nr:hypothetical protein [Actinomycetota bacterium]